MGKYTMEEEQDRTLPEDMIFRAALTEVKEKEISWTVKAGPDAGEQRTATLLEWWFRVSDSREDGRWDGRKVKLECDARLTNHPNNRFRLVSEALLGREIPVGSGVDPEDDLVGLQCDISIKHREYEKNGETKIAEEVDEVMALASDDVPF